VIDQCVHKSVGGTRAGCRGGHSYFEVFNSATITDCTFTSGSQTVAYGSKGGTGICVTQARYVSYGTSAAYMEQYTTVNVSGSRCVNVWQIDRLSVNSRGQVPCSEGDPMWCLNAVLLQIPHSVRVVFLA